LLPWFVVAFALLVAVNSADLIPRLAARAADAVDLAAGRLEGGDLHEVAPEGLRHRRLEAERADGQ
jgi:hypothetical protein